MLVAQAILEAEALRQGPCGPKARVFQPAFDWQDHVNDLSANEFRRRYRMGVKSFNLLVSLMKPHLYPSGKGANSSIMALLGSDGGSARTVTT